MTLHCMYSAIITVSTICIFLSFADATRLKDRIYFDFAVNDIAFCPRYLTPQGMVGCSSSSSGNVGVVKMIDKAQDIDVFVLKKSSTSHVLVMSLSLFVNLPTKTINQMKTNSLGVGGLLILETENKTLDGISFSEDETCPGRSFSFYSNQCSANTWNPIGTGYLLSDWPFPIVLLQNTAKMDYEQSIRSCYEKYNVKPTDHRRCALELKTFMDAIESAVTCQRRNDAMSRNALLTEPPTFCQSLQGGVNIVAHSSETSPVSSQDILLVLTRMDARSMFNGRSHGVRAVLPNLSILLSTMRHLFSLPEFRNSSGSKQVIFILLSDESYDYMGSEKLAHLLDKGTFLPQNTSDNKGIDFSAIKAVLEIGPVGAADYSNVTELFAFNRAASNDSQTVTQLLADLRKKFSKVPLNTSNTGKQLPPASVQSLLKRSTNFTSIFITDAAEKLSDNLFHSAIDKYPADNLESSKLLENIANSLSSFLYEYVTGTELKEPIKEYLPEQFVSCFATNYSCDTFNKILGSDGEKLLSSAPGPPLPTSWYFYEKRDIMTVPFLAHHLLLRLLAIPRPDLTLDLCSKINKERADSNFFSGTDVMTYNGTHCFEVPFVYDTELNPIDYRESDFQWASTSSKAAVWMVSSMSSQAQVRLFLQPGLVYEILFLVLGLVVTCVTFVFSVFIKRHKERFFPLPPVSARLIE